MSGAFRKHGSKGRGHVGIFGFDWRRPEVDDNLPGPVPEMDLPASCPPKVTHDNVLRHA
jgi:hypothetical protein